MKFDVLKNYWTAFFVFSGTLTIVVATGQTVARPHDGNRAFGRQTGAMAQGSTASSTPLRLDLSLGASVDNNMMSTLSIIDGLGMQPPQQRVTASTADCEIRRHPSQPIKAPGITGVKPTSAQSQIDEPPNFDLPGLAALNALSFPRVRSHRLKSAAHFSATRKEPTFEKCGLRLGDSGCKIRDRRHHLRNNRDYFSVSSRP